MDVRYVCPNCEAPRSGRFCAQCGQDNGIERLSTREFLRNQAQNFLSWESRLGHTLKAVVRNPGALARDYAEGKRVRYVHPARFAFIALAIWFLSMQALDIDPMQSSSVNFTRSGTAENTAATPDAVGVEDDEASSPSGPSVPESTHPDGSGESEASDEEPDLRVEDAQAFLRKYLNLFLYLALPAMAVGMRFLFRSSGRNLAEVMVFVLYLEGLQFLLAAVMSPVPLLFPAAHEQLVFAVTRALRALLIFGWFLPSARAFFGTSLWGSTWRFILARAFQVVAMLVLLVSALACWRLFKFGF